MVDVADPRQIDANALLLPALLRRCRNLMAAAKDVPSGKGSKQVEESASTWSAIHGKRSCPMVTVSHAQSLQGLLEEELTAQPNVAAS